MSIAEILLFIISIFSFIVAGFIYGRNSKSHVNIAFSLIYIFAAIWSFSLGLFRLTNDAEIAIVYAQIFNIAAIFIGASFYYFASSFPFPTFGIRAIRIILMYLPAVVVAVLLLIFPSFLLGQVHIDSNKNEVNLSNGYFFYATIFLIYITISFYHLVLKYKKSDGVSRSQLKLIILGMAFGFTVGMTFNLILPIFGIFKLVWIGPYSAFVVMIFVSYLISKNRKDGS